MNFVSRFLIGSTMAGSLLTGCSEHKPTKFEEYMGSKPYTETLEINNKIRVRAFLEDTQRYLDSVAYRDILKTTEGINDSVAVKDFNKIAAKMKGDLYAQHLGLYKTYHVSRGSLLNNLIQEVPQICANDFNKIKKAGNSVELQYLVDSIAYKNFFEKHNLMTDSVKKQIKSVCKKIRP